MKNFLVRSMFVATLGLAFATTFLTSCDKEENTVVAADKAALNAKIAECETLLAAATTDDYPQAAIDAFTTTINEVKALAESATLPQSAADNAVVALEEAKKAFLGAAYGAIPEEALILGLTFDEVVTNDQITAAGKGLVAKLTAGPAEIFGAVAAKPTIVDGKNGKAMHFAKGGHLEIPDYNTSDLIGKKLSISTWVKPDSTKAGNYVASLNYWNTWKFQIQEQNKPFFTVSTDMGGTDADNQSDFSAKNGEWTHVVVTLDLTAKKLIFYVNGAPTMEWTNETKPNLGGTMSSYIPADGTAKLPLMIGASTTYSEALVAWDWTGWNTPNGWDHFVGSMDDFKIYNIALTEGQVSKLYNDEK